MKSKTGLKYAVIAMFGAAPVVVTAATATTTFPVSTTVLTACVVTALPLVFANYDPTSATASDNTTTLSVICTSGTPYNVQLSQGANGTGVTARKMILTAGADLLPYQLFTNAGRTANWGITNGTDTVAGTATGIAQAVTVYGRIPTAATVAAGAYTDTVTVTVSY